MRLYSYVNSKTGEVWKGSKTRIHKRAGPRGFFSQPEFARLSMSPYWRKHHDKADWVLKTYELVEVTDASCSRESDEEDSQEARVFGSPDQSVCVRGTPSNGVETIGGTPNISEAQNKEEGVLDGTPA